MSVQSVEKSPAITERKDIFLLQTTDKPIAVHEGKAEDNLRYLRMASILDRRIDMIKAILNPPQSVACYSASCFGPHAIERAA